MCIRDRSRKAIVDQLGALEVEAVKADWLVASTTARRGVVAELIDDRLPRLQTEADVRGAKSRLSGLGIAGISMQRTVSDRSPTSPTLRGRIEDLLELPGVHGLLISIDELHTRAVDELAEIVDVVQHGFRENRPIAFLGAGLFPDIAELKRHPGVTFLHRARTVELPSLTFDETITALREPIEAGGRQIGDDALHLAATITQGYPYLTQVIGADSWDARPDDLEITRDDVVAAFPAAHQLMNEQVLRPTLARVPEALVEYVLAMAVDDGPSLAQDLENRLDIASNTLANRRSRLLHEYRMIVAARHGSVDFAMPYLREFLRDVAAERAHRHVVDHRPEFPPLPPLPGRALGQGNPQ